MTVIAPIETVKEEEADKKQKLYYKVEDVPGWSTTILFGIQQVLVCTSSIVSAPLFIAKLLCAGENPLARVKLIGTLVFVSGLSTILQSTFGTRLPLLQGPSFAYFPSIMALMSLPEHKCQAINATLFSNTTNEATTDNNWMNKMQIIQGGLIVASLVEMLIGFTGVIGYITKYIGPLTIAPLMLLLSISTMKICADYAIQHWMSGVTMLFLLIVALYMEVIQVPLPTFKRKKCTTTKVPLFALFPYLIAITIVWCLCVILTATNVFNVQNHKAVRTDVNAHVIGEAPWFRWPYPFQWGLPQWNVGVILGVIAGSLTSFIESVGAYHACARVTELPPPPSHAVNRGVLMEGFCCLIGGILGGGVGVTTYSENIGVIGITKVASRRTMQAAGCILVLLGLFTKVGAVMATIPDPLVGGILAVSFAMVAGVGLSSLQLIDLRLSRNTAILGFSIMLGILVPSYFEKVPIRTGSDTADQVLSILLAMNMFVGGVVGFILDNTIPGATKRQRGLTSALIDDETSGSSSAAEPDESLAAYSFSLAIMKYINKCRITRYLPFMPNFRVATDSRNLTQDSVKY